ncbi:tyrosine-type recombinase/integrase [Deinococcus aquiradiocola]|nr:site-specific integrase [Deinococcus aquiradiocola]
MTLDVYRGQAHDRARTWTALTPDERRRRATEAAALKDPDTLWSLTEAHLTLHAASGVLTSRHTLTSYRAGIRAFLHHATHRAWSILRPTADDVQAWIAEMLTQGRAIATVRVRVAAAAALYRALRWAGATAAHPFEDAVVPKDRRHGLEKNAPYTADQVDLAVAAASAHPTRASELRALLLVLAHAGLRIDEALHLRWEDVHLDPDSARLTVQSGKGRRSRSVPASPRLRAALSAYRILPRTRAHRGDFIFPYRTWRGAARHVRPLFEHAQEPGGFRGFHALRKAMGSRLYQQLGDFAAVAEVLGHADINTTRGYVRIGEERARRAIDSW